MAILRWSAARRSQARGPECCSVHAVCRYADPVHPTSPEVSTVVGIPTPDAWRKPTTLTIRDQRGSISSPLADLPADFTAGEVTWPGIGRRYAIVGVDVHVGSARVHRINQIAERMPGQRANQVIGRNRAL